MRTTKYNALSDAKIRGQLAAGRHADGRGLVLWVSAQGTKTWQLRYRIGKDENTFTIGRFPDVSLAEARREAEKARSLVSKGVHPKDAQKALVAQRKAECDDTFGKLAAEWLAGKELASDSQRVYSSALAQVLPALGKLPVADVDASTIRNVLDGLKARTTRKNAFMIIRGVLDDAAEVNQIPVNPMRVKAMKAENHRSRRGLGPRNQRSSTGLLCLNPRL